MMSLDKLEMLRFSTKSEIWENLAGAIEGKSGQLGAIEMIEDNRQFAFAVAKSGLWERAPLKNQEC